MPEARLARTRATLPEGYQFGNARVLNAITRVWFPLVRPWRPLHENAAERLKRSQTEYDGT